MKTLIITVEDTEEEIVDRILLVLNAGKNIFKALKQRQFRNMKN